MASWAAALAVAVAPLLVLPPPLVGSAGMPAALPQVARAAVEVAARAVVVVVVVVHRHPSPSPSPCLPPRMGGTLCPLHLPLHLRLHP